VSPSTAALAGKDAFSVEDAVAGRPWDSNWSAAWAGEGLRAAKKATIRTTTRPRAVRERTTAVDGLPGVPDTPAELCMGGLLKPVRRAGGQEQQRLRERSPGL
jgi:hypothetical protein